MGMSARLGQKYSFCTSINCLQKDYAIRFKVHPSGAHCLKAPSDKAE